MCTLIAQTHIWGILDVSDELGGVDLYCIDGQVHNKAVNLSKQTKLQSTDDLETM